MLIIGVSGENWPRCFYPNSSKYLQVVKIKTFGMKPEEEGAG
jgi:hypothetical protein